MGVQERQRRGLLAGQDLAEREVHPLVDTRRRKRVRGVQPAGAGGARQEARDGMVTVHGAAE